MFGLQKVPQSNAVADSNGLVTRPWYWFFYALFASVDWLTPGSGNLANIPTNLTAQDKGKQFEATDYKHLYEWNGSAWHFAPGDPGSNYIVTSGSTPQGGLWGACNGSTYSVAQDNATIANVVSPNTPGSFLRR